MTEKNTPSLRFAGFTDAWEGVGQKLVTPSVRFRCPTPARLSRVVRAGSISELEPTQLLRLDVFTKLSQKLVIFTTFFCDFQKMVKKLTTVGGGCYYG